MTTLTEPETPFALVDVARLDRNIERLRSRLDAMGVPLRLHVKTAKSLDVVGRVHSRGPEPITVSTLAEAEYFAAAGYTDILYAVGIAPHKLTHVADLARRGVTVTVLLDSEQQAVALEDARREHGVEIPAVIEIDCDGHRGGIAPTDPALLEIGRILSAGHQLAGVLTHAGESYNAKTPEELRAAAQNERDTIVDAAERLRSAGLECRIVSLGSTPTALSTTDLAGVTEVRAGNYVFLDLYMAGLGICELEDLALGVVVSVIGHRPEKGWILTDGGWMATSSDRSTATQPVDCGYGLVTDLDGRLIPDLVMSGASQEHGVLSLRSGSSHQQPDLPIGTRVRILPNHACATAAQHDRYHVIDSSQPAPHTGDVIGEWPRHNGW